MSAVEKRLTRGLRVLRDDLWNVRADPLPPSVWLRWLPHGLVYLVAISTTLLTYVLITDSYNQGEGYGLLCSSAQGAAVALALWRPVPALWLSTAVSVVIAMGARFQLIAGQVDSNVPWPFAPDLIVAHSMVLFLLALRVPTRVAVEALALTALVTYVMQGLVGAVNYWSTGVTAVALFAGVTLLGTALRGRREARTELVEQASLTAEERSRRTLLEERNRIARELHDVVAHHMSVISIQAQVAPHLVENPSDELRENLDGIRQNALEALTELRRVLGVLRSENPDDPYGLGAPGTGAAPDAPQPTLDRLDALVENTRGAGLTVTTEITGEQFPLAPGVELSAYRIVQEALSNALRHAPGSVVRVELTHFPRGLQIRVVNSAPRRPAPPSPGAGHGLLGMRERAMMLGGTLMAMETSCGGFTVAAFLPRSGTTTSGTTPRPDNSTDPKAHTESAGRTDPTGRTGPIDPTDSTADPTDPTGETP
ncbi:sensor histidine kinase [Streptomyces sp. NBC_00878]|uniref:sensor histidine kinase n=1 Tax=Streptomyces sp. NBC_00878 TaxID=2975854 RepID=UPI0022591430|nr:sensor histidine kinase [Streptomyces sp. NBC_00878]MCX4907572.1 sensor histidine kinase [Streptomyces sp. NBC_00878]